MDKKDNNKDKTLHFTDIQDYLTYIRKLSQSEKEKLFSDLPLAEQADLIQQHKKGGWADVALKNEIDNHLNNLKKKHKIDFWSIKVKVGRGKSVYLPAKTVDILFKTFKGYGKLANQLFSGLVFTHCLENKSVILVTHVSPRLK